MLTPTLPPAGATLVELLVSLAIALLITLGTVSAYAVVARHGGEVLKSARLEHDLRSLSGLMERELRRAGHWGALPWVVEDLANPFALPPHRLALGAYPGEEEESCIIYAYDLDGDGRVDRGTGSESDERFGFRLRRGAVEMRNGGSSFGCREAGWQTVTDPGIELSALRFSIDSRPSSASCRAGAPCEGSTFVSIRLAGRLRKTPEIAFTVETQVQVRNLLPLPGEGGGA